MPNEGFYELFSLLKKHKASFLHIQYHTFNTRANRDAIICSVIRKIFNSVQMLDGHISTFLIDTCDLFLLVNNCSLPVIYCSTFVQCFVQLFIV
jgi:hypothetical protein